MNDHVPEIGSWFTRHKNQILASGAAGELNIFFNLDFGQLTTFLLVLPETFFVCFVLFI